MTDSPAIRVMPEALALKIAAGEVVERPASAVKELLDNAIDAGARHIKVEVREAGLKLVRVTDDGCGIAPSQLDLAFSSHATSKISALDDLEHLTTLGFRGEALPSIAAVSRVEVQTRLHRAPSGSRIAIEFGRVVDGGTCSAPAGLRISVRDLFGNVPARRKFVRSLRAETGQIASVVTQYALARPTVHIGLWVEGRLSFQSPGTGNLGDALAAVYGAAMMPHVRPVEHEESGMRVEGLICGPELTRPSRAAMRVFVNGRVIQNRSLVFALEEAYGGYLMVGRHPVAALHVSLPPEEVDANVHPSKNEVRFARDREVHGALHRAVANALLEIRSPESRGSIAIDGDGARPAPDMALPFEPENGGKPASAPDAADQVSLLPGMPVLRVFGQTKDAFIIAEGPDGLYMIDQHAAHERILFDRLEEQLSTGSVASQPLLDPAAVELEPAQLQALDENGELLRRTGFVVEAFGTGSCLVRAVPALSARSAPAELVDEVLRDIQNLSDPDAAKERALAAMACKGAVKAGQALDVQEMRELVAQLEQTLRPATCPHGRPTMIHLSHMQLEREFGRR
jgi:DNA mismatch repair protein MutL